MAEKESQKVNDLIFKELIKRGYSLQGNTRVWDIADSKLWYLTPEQAQAYLDLENSQEFKESASNIEFDLINKNIKEISKKIGTGPINIVDLGCGDGKKAAYIFSRLKNKSKIRYCPVDISGHMVGEAIKTFSGLDVEEVIECQYNISDFENLENLSGLLRKGEFKKGLFLLLGHTLGNFEVNEILYEIRSAMGWDDVLVIVSGIENEKWAKWAKEKKSDDKMDNFFGKIPKLLGLDEKDVEFGARFKHKRVEYYYTIKNSKTIEFQNKKVALNKGDQVIVAVSYKHNKDDILSILNMQFRDVTLKLSEEGSTFLAICKK
ncbi:L-histidine N(alpha)-methyltransferase [Candidatus Pacearchaeota archaeon]|nr:L-histidine N(alpha)-methyltransferase [Candidatus Pacearchaeota archaeon]